MPRLRKGHSFCLHPCSCVLWVQAWFFDNWFDPFRCRCKSSLLSEYDDLFPFFYSWFVPEVCSTWVLRPIIFSSMILLLAPAVDLPSTWICDAVLSRALTSLWGKKCISYKQGFNIYLFSSCICMVSPSYDSCLSCPFENWIGRNFRR